MVYALANRGERDRSHISLQRPAEVRFWTRHLGVGRPALEAAIAKVGNSAVAVQKSSLVQLNKNRPESTRERHHASPLRFRPQERSQHEHY